MPRRFAGGLLAVVIWIAALDGMSSPIRVLVLSGANNHDWRATTPVLEQALKESGVFSVTVETNVPGLRASSFEGYDVVLSNFNSFGLRDPGSVWNHEVRAAFVDFIRSGHGLVIIHAGSAVFYDWPEFQQIAGATWGKTTGHGKMHTNEVHIVAANHPVTAGLKDFETLDEFWQSAQVASGARALAVVTPKMEFGGSGKPEPIVFATEFGAGRGFTLLLGHNSQAMKSQGFKALLRRGTEWAATGKVMSDKSAKN
jgi:type 1 glutamine amidotransferase